MQVCKSSVLCSLVIQSIFLKYHITVLLFHYHCFIIRECVQHAVFLAFYMGFRLQVVFAPLYMFPINIILTEFAKQHVN